MEQNGAESAVRLQSACHITSPPGGHFTVQQNDSMSTPTYVLLTHPAWRTKHAPGSLNRNLSQPANLLRADFHSQKRNTMISSLRQNYPYICLIPMTGMDYFFFFSRSQKDILVSPVSLSPVNLICAMLLVAMAIFSVVKAWARSRVCDHVSYWTYAPLFGGRRWADPGGQLRTWIPEATWLPWVNMTRFASSVSTPTCHLVKPVWLVLVLQWVQHEPLIGFI